MPDKVLVHDVSYHQGDLSRYWQLFKDKGCKAIICQSSNGLAYQQYFHDTIKEAKEQGFLVGSYHYYRQHIVGVEGGYVPCDPLRQVQNYYNWVQKCPVKMDLPPVLDIENGGNPYGLSASKVEQTLSFIEKLFKRTPLLYSSPSILGGIAKPEWKKYPLWIANYNETPTIPAPWETYTLWQFSDKITYTPEGSTLKKPIDHNWFNGDEADLFDFCYGEDPGGHPEPPEPKTHVRVKVGWLFFRSSPELYGGACLVVGYGSVLKLLSLEKVHGDIDYWHVEADGRTGYVSAGSAFTELV